MNNPLPVINEERPAVLPSSGALDSSPDAEFDALTRLAALLCGTPIALISLVDADRLRFKSPIGISAGETPRHIAFCAHAIRDASSVLEIPDASVDSRFANNPLVTAEPHIRFYAGAPLVSKGNVLGALCVMDHKPRKLEAGQLEGLRTLARQVIAQLELRNYHLQVTTETAERKRAQFLLNQHIHELAASRKESERLLALDKKSRLALLSVLEDEKKIGEKLRASEEMFRQLAENIREVFWITAPRKRRMLYVSPAYEAVCGRTCQSLYDNPLTWLDAIHPEDRDRVLKATAKQADAAYDEEYRIIRPDGATRWIHDRAFPVKDQEGRVYRVVGVAEDVTERRRLEADWAQAQKMEGIGQLAGGVAHDFNNMLAIIQMQAGLLRGSLGLSSAQLEYTNEIDATVRRAADLTRQLLLFSRREVFQPRNFDLNESVMNTAKLLKRILGENIEMHLNLASQPILVHADPAMMDQVLMNLAVNARDAMPKGGRLAVETSVVEFDEERARQRPSARAGSFACLRVTDSGCGIPAENLQKIFEPFFTTKGPGKGTGLGLATVFGIAQQHQGWIDVHSELGHGTTFKVYFPRLIGQKALNPPAKALKDIRGGHETILLAEDDPSLRGSIRKALAHLGYRILEAPTGVKALEVWKQNKNEIGLLLTDLVMPGEMTGKDLAQSILREDPKIKVVFMSGYSTEVAGPDFPLREGINFLSKPFQAVNLAKTVRENLDQPKW